jgi:hypothetical protein
LEENDENLGKKLKKSREILKKIKENLNFWHIQKSQVLRNSVNLIKFEKKLREILTNCVFEKLG